MLGVVAAVSTYSAPATGHEWVACPQCQLADMLAKPEDIGNVVCPNCAETLVLDPEVFAAELDELFREHGA